MKKFAALLPFALLLLFGSARVHAQGDIGGCDDSPENPTVVLGLIVGAGSFGYLRVRDYLRARKNIK